MLHADETGWRVNGRTHWLWGFAAPGLTYYRIDRSHGSPALMKFFTEAFAGTLVSDFWGAYNAVICAQRQVCLVHLLRDLENVEHYRTPDKDWPDFAKTLRRLLRDAIRPAVIIRKNSYANRSERGADTQAVLMSIYRTLKQRGHHPLNTIVKAIETRLITGQLPPLPSQIAPSG